MSSASPMRGRFLLIVEDEPLIALDVAEEISACGGRTVVVSSVRDALSALSRVKFAAAIVDHRLGPDDASEVIRRLELLQTPYVIHTGYEEVESWARVPVVRKPAVSQHLMQTVSDLIADSVYGSAPVPG